MQNSGASVVKDLILVGGGHAHVSVLRKFGMQPIPGLRITLITRDIHTPYSGMLPGYIAGHYNYDECHIDLGPLARFANARLYHDEVTQLDLENRLVHVQNRPPVSYDLISINSGSRPSVMDVPGADEFALVAKPIDVFLQRWEKLQRQVEESSGEFKVVIVGGGAGGVELALSAQLRLKALLSSKQDNPNRLKFSLLTQGSGILFTHNEGVQKRFIKVLAERNIDLLLNHSVTEITHDSVIVKGDKKIHANACIFVTNASAPEWPKQSGLNVDDGGFISVNHYLQSTSHSEVFAVGDVASLPDPRPKSGVFAVRQGPVLTKNLISAATNQSLTKYRAQKNFLGLISTGDKYAVASRGSWSWQGEWLWKAKDWIDRQFMGKFNVLPEMDDDGSPNFATGLADEDAIKELSTLAMRCGGCGAKVGSGILSRVMQRLPVNQRDDVLIGRDSPDDSAMLAVPAGKVMVQSIDYFRAFIDDPYLFGAIAANHALGDLYAMGAEPQSVLALATVPYGREKIVEESLYELLAGALKTLESTGAVLVGGHSAEGAELAFGLTVNGIVDPDKVWRKQGLKTGDKLILTKPIGTGTLFAADMRRKAKGRWVDNAINTMLLSNQQAAHCLQKYHASSCTDVTGFGLVGHLMEMTRASNVDAEIFIDAVPILDGAKQTVAAGILSSLQPQNLRLRRAIENIQLASKHSDYPLLFDPQTAGGLLAGVPAEYAQQCVEELNANGYADACVIGVIKHAADADAPIKIIV
ncbi:MAG: selenide, water dikinase SelD [Gammaproteobacteria bacterium]